MKEKNTITQVFFHGSNDPELTLDDIDDEHISTGIALGPGFYVKLTRNGAALYGPHIYKVEVDYKDEIPAISSIESLSTFQYRMEKYKRVDGEENIYTLHQDDDVTYTKEDIWEVYKQDAIAFRERWREDGHKIINQGTQYTIYDKNIIVNIKRIGNNQSNLPT